MPQAAFTGPIAMPRTIFQQSEDIVEDLAEVTPGQLGIARAARQGIIEVNVEMKCIIAISRRNDAESRSKLRRIEIELWVAACSQAQAFRNRIKRIFERAQ